MTYTGTIKGYSIELQEKTSFRDGEKVAVHLEPLAAPPGGSIEALLEAVRRSTPLSKGDTDALEQSIKEGQLPLSPPPEFD